MIHISNQQDVDERLPGKKWRKCFRRAEVLRYILPEVPFAVETEGGTLSRGTVDVLMEGGTRELYSLKIADFKRCCSEFQDDSVMDYLRTFAKQLRVAVGRTLVTDEKPYPQETCTVTMYSTTALEIAERLEAIAAPAQE